RHGDLWLGAQNIGVLHMRRDGGRIVNYSHSDGDTRQLAHGTVHALLEDAKGRIWMGTGDGLSLLDPANGQLRHFRHGLNEPASLSGNLVRALHLDAQGTVWVGT